jgi:hypothetical protein
MHTEKLELSLRSELESYFNRGRDDEMKEAKVALESINETLSVELVDLETIW